MTANDSNALLGNIKVVELATMVFAPSCCVILADFGAQVIKVEPLKTGDLNRNYHTLPGMPKSDIAYTFQMDNRNKKSLSLDLKSAAGYEIFSALVAQADIVVTNYRAKALDTLKADYESLKALNPKLIYAHAQGYGDKGEESHKPGYDNVCYWSRSGIETQLFPYEGWLPIFPFGSGDHPSGTSLYAAIMTALYQRSITGEGCKVSASLLGNGAWANATMLQGQLCDAKFNEKRPRAKAYNFTSLHYRSKDNRFLKLGIVNEQKDWPLLCTILSMSELLHDPRFTTAKNRAENMELLISLIDAEFVKHEMAYWKGKFEQGDIPFAVVPTYEEAANDPQKAANNIVVELDHPEHGKIRTINSPFSVSNLEKEKPQAAPQLGQHSREILSGLGYPDEDIDQLLDKGIIQTGLWN